MKMEGGADSNAMEMAGSAADYGSHRVIDPEDPPREMSGLAWGAMVCLGLIAILSLVKTGVALNLHSVAGDGGDIIAALCAIAAAALGIMVVSRLSKRLDEIRAGVLAPGPAASQALPAPAPPAG